VENETLTVSATEFDRQLSATNDYVSLEGDRAIWRNSWDAAGKEVTWDMVHYDVQLIGGIALHQGKIAEMQTGEGKTLVATLPLYLNALTGNGTHLVTVNDYLAKRDSAWMGPLFEFHGLSVDCIDKHQPNSDGRRAAYNADITYGTNNEFGFDYLRDNMAHTPADLVQRPHHYAIVDGVEVFFVDNLRRAVDFGERAEEAELLAVFAVSPLPLVFAADADIHVAHRHIPALIAGLPFLQELGPGMRIPHQLAGRIERACDTNFAITRQGNFCGLGHCLVLGDSS
jgi:hypothetical protein